MSHFNGRSLIALTKRSIPSFARMSERFPKAAKELTELLVMIHELDVKNVETNLIFTDSPEPASGPEVAVVSLRITREATEMCSGFTYMKSDNHRRVHLTLHVYETDEIFVARTGEARVPLAPCRNELRNVISYALDLIQ